MGRKSKILLMSSGGSLELSWAIVSLLHQLSFLLVETFSERWRDKFVSQICNFVFSSLLRMHIPNGEKLALRIYSKITRVLYSKLFWAILLLSYNFQIMFPHVVTSFKIGQDTFYKQYTMCIPRLNEQTNQWTSSRAPTTSLQALSQLKSESANLS